MQCRAGRLLPMRFASSTSDGMPTPMSLGMDITFQANDDASTKKLAIICGWMGAKPKQLKTYNAYYLDKGFSTLTFAVGPQHVLKPESALDLMRTIVDESLALDPKIIAFHNFSVGGYLFGQMLRVLEGHERKTDFVSRVKSQVFDSPPDFRGIAAGVGASMGANPFVAKPVEYLIRGYLKAVENTAGVEHRASSAHFHGNTIRAPSLWFYSLADPVANYEDCLTVINKWRAGGTEVEEVVWEHTPHIQHGRKDPERYFGSLDLFLARHGLIDTPEGDAMMPKEGVA